MGQTATDRQPPRVGPLAARDRTVNGVEGGASGLLGPFLEAYFPVPSAYGLPA